MLAPMYSSSVGLLQLHVCTIMHITCCTGVSPNPAILQHTLSVPLAKYAPFSAVGIRLFTMWTEPAVVTWCKTER